MNLYQVNTPSEHKKIISKVIKPFSDRAAIHDEEGSFPFQNLADLKSVGYPSLTVPKKYGGQGLNLSEWLPLQEMIAQADGSTALSIGWHIGIISQLNDKKTWPTPVLEHLYQDIVQNGAILNAAATEPETGSPTRGGKPTTTAKKVDDGWLLSGRKSFTSMAPALDYILITATMPDDRVGQFLLHKSDKGVRIEETWNTIAMRGTASHDLYLDDVVICADHLVDIVVPGQKSPAGWLLHIPACYLGIAQAAQSFALSYASTYSPNSLPGPIKDLPTIQTKIGENEAALMQARYFLYGVAAKWDRATDEERLEMQGELGAAKYHVVNAAVEIVDRAMRVVGAQSLFKEHPLQRYYRDVRAGLHNPPMDDMTLLKLASEAFLQIEDVN
ncbi:acyl-CoA dehydrogenase family protein [Halalkalibacter nanhaiisediminis]|uniref:Alkylation response protein AidB-like acyl-CoA dehydrogenase n=1 Tax=Halalkalibacter nanhaiisediminis TaxID=688079 RepID=A0A562QMJ6_9BACI|nr:acyl-CoA dehydrogenase family protein [Halalkalibacter nanhaiisediminis]TWI57981.1 alkylation response protein AidB-like acyl-CoA dehydrogenase [Halalkalibacter nanhaiisediminis]